MEDLAATMMVRDFEETIASWMKKMTGEIDVTGEVVDGAEADAKTVMVGTAAKAAMSEEMVTVIEINVNVVDVDGAESPEAMAVTTRDPNSDRCLSGK